MTVRPASITCTGSPSARARSVGILSTYPPTACGLATFSAALARGLLANGVGVRIVRITDDVASPSELVVGEHVNGSSRSVTRSVELLNAADVAIIQHEYGIYGGTDGDEVLEILARLEVPSVVIAHTVLRDPTPHQRSLLVEVCAEADQVVVMSEAARQRLCTRFGVEPAAVLTIAHGATVATGLPAVERGAAPVILTSGLIGPGKGIERVIDSMRSLQGLSSRPRYLVAGQTHPKVLANAGESYRESLIERAARNGVAASVRFDSEYRDVASMTELIHSAAVVVLPYDSTDQVTSGVLVDAIAAGRPVVATAFPHAAELLSSGAGVVVDHDDPDGLVLALRRILEEPALAGAMAAEAARIAPSLGWSVIAAAYVELAQRLVAPESVLT